MNDESKTPNIAIVGRPNVGKSALFNRLVGRKIAIVHDQPGITRDRISAVCNRASRPFMVWDTGGVGGAGESELLAQVRHTAEKAINESELLLLLVDAKQGLSPIDEELARMLRKSRASGSKGVFRSAQPTVAASQNCSRQSTKSSRRPAAKMAVLQQLPRFTIHGSRFTKSRLSRLR